MTRLSIRRLHERTRGHSVHLNTLRLRSLAEGNFWLHALLEYHLTISVPDLQIINVDLLSS